MGDQPDVGLRVFVDLSNVTKDPLLGPSNEHAALHRWERLKAVWIRDRGAPDRFTLVADDSLPRGLSRADQVSLDRLVAQGDAVSVPDADIEVLRRAVEVRGVALSNDRYVDHRRTAGLARAQLVGWVVRGLNIRLEERSLERLLSAVISARAHKQALKDLGLNEDSPQLAQRWFCRDPACPESLIALPLVDRGSTKCPSCGSFLEAGELWRDPIWLKVMLGKDEVLRFVLEDGESVFVGSGDSDDVLSLADCEDASADLAHIDKRHLQLENQSGALFARDNATSRGSVVRLPAGRQRNLLTPPVSLSAARSTRVGVGTKIMLGGTRFAVQISGGADRP